MLVISFHIARFHIQSITHEYITPALLPVMMQFAFKPPMEVDWPKALSMRIVVNAHSVWTQTMQINSLPMYITFIVWTRLNRPYNSYCTSNYGITLWLLFLCLWISLVMYHYFHTFFPPVSSSVKFWKCTGNNRWYFVPGLKIMVCHRLFSNPFWYMADQIQFGRTNFIVHFQWGSHR